MAQSMAKVSFQLKLKATIQAPTIVTIDDETRPNCAPVACHGIWIMDV